MTFKLRKIVSKKHENIKIVSNIIQNIHIYEYMIQEMNERR